MTNQAEAIAPRYYVLTLSQNFTTQRFPYQVIDRNDGRMVDEFGSKRAADQMAKHMNEASHNGND